MVAGDSRSGAERFLGAVGAVLGGFGVRAVGADGGRRAGWARVGTGRADCLSDQRLRVIGRPASAARQDEQVVREERGADSRGVARPAFEQAARQTERAFQE